MPEPTDTRGFEDAVVVSDYRDAGCDSLELIPQRSKDGYVNATAMFKAAGKSVVDYMRLDANKEFMNELEGSVRILTDPLVISTTTGPNELRSTWIHPDMAVNPSHRCHR